MLTFEEKIKNLEAILGQNISLTDKQILLKEIARLKQELTKNKKLFNERISMC